jgi:hypothetical protein
VKNRAAPDDRLEGVDDAAGRLDRSGRVEGEVMVEARLVSRPWKIVRRAAIATTRRGRMASPNRPAVMSRVSLIGFIPERSP